MASDERKLLKNVKSLNDQSEKYSNDVCRINLRRSPRGLTKVKSYKNLKSQDNLTKELENLAANYRFFFENVAQFGCSEVSFKNFLGDSELINCLFSNKIKGRFREPPTTTRLIDDIFNLCGNKNPSFKKGEKSLTDKNKYNNIENYSLELLRKFSLKLEEINIEWKMKGIKNLENRIFDHQEAQKISEHKILPKIFKNNKQQFYDVLEICDSQQSQILPSIDYNIWNKLANFERISGELDQIEKTNRIVSKGLDKLYEKCQLKYYTKNNGRTITLC